VVRIDFFLLLIQVMYIIVLDISIFP
jgi:hypothetical protein